MDHDSQQALQVAKACSGPEMASTSQIAILDEIKNDYLFMWLQVLDLEDGFRVPHVPHVPHV